MTALPGANCDATGRCITCSDEATPMRVLTVGACDATCVDESGAIHEVAIDLLAGLGPGTTVLVHAGVAIGAAP
jgi:hydrogenase maturation factor